MAIRQGTMLNDSDGRTKYVWTGLLNADSGTPVGGVGSMNDYTIQVVGTFGAAGSVAFQGSNDGVNFFVLDDVAAAPANITTQKITKLAQVPMFLRPVVTAGDGTTNLSVFVVSDTD